MAYGWGTTDAAVTYTLPTPQLGSDPDGRTRDHGDIVHERLGLTVGVRRWARVRRFRLNYTAISESAMWSIRTMVSNRYFYYYTDTGSLTSVYVRVVDGTYAPTYLGPGAGGGGLWSVSVELQEIVT